MDEDCMLDWIRHCFAPSLPPISSGKRTLLVLDSHRAHITAACYQLFNELNVDVVVIPGCSSFVTDLNDLQCIWNSFSLCFLGLTSVLQPLDRCINGPIEKLLVGSWSVWFEEQESSLDYLARTKGGNLRSPSQGAVLGWLAAAIASLSSNRGDLLSRAFKYCGITNNLDGTEYDMIYEQPETEENDGSKNSSSLEDADQADHDDMEVDVADESSTKCGGGFSDDGAERQESSEETDEMELDRGQENSSSCSPYPSSSSSPHPHLPPPPFSHLVPLPHPHPHLSSSSSSTPLLPLRRCLSLQVYSLNSRFLLPRLLFLHHLLLLHRHVPLRRQNLQFLSFLHLPSTLTKAVSVKSFFSLPFSKLDLILDRATQSQHHLLHLHLLLPSPPLPLHPLHPPHLYLLPDPALLGVLITQTLNISCTATVATYCTSSVTVCQACSVSRSSISIAICLCSACHRALCGELHSVGPCPWPTCSMHDPVRFAKRCKQEQARAEAETARWREHAQPGKSEREEGGAESVKSAKALQR